LVVQEGEEGENPQKRRVSHGKLQERKLIDQKVVFLEQEKSGKLHRKD